MALNLESVPAMPCYEDLLDRFPEQYREKLRCYTCEELYYVYSLAIFKAKRDKNGDYKSGDILYLSLKAKLFRWLKGQDKYGLSPSIWNKLGSKFRYGYQEYLSEVEGL